MTLRVKFSLYSTIWAIVWLLAGHSSGWAQTSPSSASAIRQTEQDNNIRIIGKLCVPRQAAPQSGSATGGGSNSTVSGNANCDNNTVSFQDVDPGADRSRTVWVVDGGQPQTGEFASTSFTTPGTKIITLTRSLSSVVPNQPGSTTTTSFSVSVGTPPPAFQQWRGDTMICKGTVLEIKPYPNGAPQGVTYLWYPKGETSATLSTTASGCYSVEVTNEEGCSVQDRVQVRLCPEQNSSPGSKWYFGTNAGLDFAGGNPSPLDNGKLSTIEGSASITDTKGNVLFYTDGITIFDKDGKPMQLFDPVSGTLTSASATLGGNQRSTQSAIIVPKPVCRGCDYEYYVYTTAEINGTRQLTYSIVDMRRNGGAGAVVAQNLPIVTSSTSTSSTERSASVRRDRDTTYWVMTHDYGSNCFRVNHLTAQVQTSQRTFCLGTAHDSPVRGEGQMKFGPAPQPVSTTATSGTGTSGTAVSGTATQGSSNTAVRPVAVVIPGDSTSSDPERRKSFVEIFSFNTETGELTGPDKRIDLGPAPPTAYGVEFSPDGRQVYVSLLGSTSLVNGQQTQTGPSQIRQYNITDADPSSTSALVAQSTLQQFGSLQIGPDGKIYVAVQGATSLGVIDNPNGGTSGNPLSQTATFTLEGQTLGGRNSQLGLPNQVANFSQPSNNPGVSATNVCQGDPVTLNITPYCPPLKERYSMEVRRQDTNGLITSWTNFTTTSQTVTTAPGTYTVTLFVTVLTATGTSCTTATAGTAFTVTAYPSAIDLGPDIVRCDTDPTPIVLDAKVEAELYAWVRFVGNSTRGFVVGRQRTLRIDPSNPANAGTYRAYAANGSGDCPVQDEIKIDLFLPSRINLGPDVPLCDRSTRTLSLPPVQQQGFTSFAWSSSALSTTLTTPTIDVTRPGTYSLVASFDRPLPGGQSVTCRSRDQIDVIGVRNPTLTAALRQPASCTALDGAISITPGPTNVISASASPTSSFTYSWTTVSGTPISTTGSSATALAEGTYRVRVTDENTCVTDTALRLQSNSPRLAITPRTTNAQCGEPTSGTIAMVITGGGTLVGQPRWSSPPGSSITVSESGTVATGLTPSTVYSFSATNELGCVSSATASVGVSTTATLSLAPDRSRCAGDTVQLIPSRLGSSAGNVGYQWSTGETSGSISVRTAGVYSLTATNRINGCVGTARVNVNFVQKPNVSAGANLSLCLGGAGSLTAVQLTGASPANGSWSAVSGVAISPQGSLTLLPTQVGQTITAFYSVTVNGCANSAARQIALNQTPTVSAGPDDRFCEGIGRTIQATGSPGALFRWNDGTQGSVLRPNRTGTYVVTASVNGCENTDDVLVTVDPAPRINLTREVFICVGDQQQAQLRVVPGDPTTQSVVWTPSGTTSTTLLVGSVGTYSVVVTGANGCTTRDAAVVIDRCEPRLFTPTAFSPNGDGTNEQFNALYAYVTDVELRVFNRWGEVIFASTPDQPAWDGTYHGEPVPSMVYPFTVTYKSEYFPERPAVVKRGSVLLVR